MSRLSTLSDGDMTKFKRILGEDITAEDARRIILRNDPSIVAVMARAMREHPAFRLIHGRFHSLEEKVEIVKAWPGVSDRFTEADFTRAVEEARDSGLLDRFGTESPKNPLLNVVISVYLGSVVETFLYGRDRLRDAFGEKFAQWDNAYETPDLHKRLVLLDGIKTVTNCLKVEVIDLGANWNRERGFIPKDIRGAKSAHVQVLYAGVEDPDWVRQMNPDQGVPYALMGGYVLSVPGSDDGTGLPGLWFSREHGRARLHGIWYGIRYHVSSLPVVWE
jgi:hypothetical protein